MQVGRIQQEALLDFTEAPLQYSLPGVDRILPQFEHIFAILRLLTEGQEGIQEFGLHVAHSFGESFL